jgi:hypothetical protein
MYFPILRPQRDKCREIEHIGIVQRGLIEPFACNRQDYKARSMDHQKAFRLDVGGQMDKM